MANKIPALESRIKELEKQIRLSKYLLKKNSEDQKLYYLNSWKWRVGSLLIDSSLLIYDFFKNPISSIRLFKVRIIESYINLSPGKSKNNPEKELFDLVSTLTRKLKNVKLISSGDSDQNNSEILFSEIPFFTAKGMDLYLKPSSLHIYSPLKPQKKWIWIGDYSPLNNTINKKISFFNIRSDTLYNLSFHGDFINEFCDYYLKFYIFEFGNNKLLNTHEKTYYPSSHNPSIVFKTHKKSKIIRIGILFNGTYNIKIDKILLNKTEKNIDNSTVDIITFPKYQPQKITKYKNLTIGAILDPFSYNCLKYEANIIPLDPLKWRSQIIHNNPHFVLIESAWFGLNKEWDYTKTKYLERKNSPVYKILQFCHKKNIKTVFWNKEDPISYEIFLNVASQCDYIFTSDSDSIPKYKRDLKHNRIFALLFAAQPIIHNPFSPLFERHYNVCFAGSWKPFIYPERSLILNILLYPALEYDLHIFDRMLNSTSKPNTFPFTFQESIKGSLSYDEMLTAYRAYKIFLNVNTVTDSPTMFARRVFELLACGTPVISTESIGVEKFFDQIVKITTSHSETTQFLKKFLSDIKYREKISHLGYREVLEKHTYSHRIKEILEKIELDFKPLKDNQIVSIICFVTESKNLENVLNNFSNQIIKQKELFLLFDSEIEQEFDSSGEQFNNKSITLVRVNQNHSRSDLILESVSKCQGNYIAFFNENDLYGPHYLSDLLLPLKYIEADIIGKNTFFKNPGNEKQFTLISEGNEHKFVSDIFLFTSICKKESIIKTAQIFKEPDNLISTKKHNLKIYSADKYNYLNMNHDKSSEQYLEKNFIMSQVLTLTLNDVMI